MAAQGLPRSGKPCWRRPAAANAPLEMRRAVLRMDLGQPDGVNVAEKLTRDRAAER